MNLLLPFVRWFERRLYTRFASIYDVVAWLVSTGQWTRWQVVGIERLPAGRILEIGHGPGHVLLRLARAGRPAIGLDVSSQMSRIAARRLERAGHARPLLRGRAQALPFPASSFDGILSTFPSAYIVEPATMAEAARVLRTGGAFVIVPGAYVRGHSLPDRLAAWINRVTGEAQELPEGWMGPFVAHGFEPSLERVRLPRAEVLCITARKGVVVDP
jgi:ubiquinone/menaquinone biosynthesis C-methylase UbiE